MAVGGGREVANAPQAALNVREAPEGIPIVVPHRFESEGRKTRSYLGTPLACANCLLTTSRRLAFYNQKLGRFPLLPPGITILSYNDANIIKLSAAAVTEAD